jgi:hypothetical protein
MNAISDRGFKALSWSTIIMFALGFWLSGSLILDLVIVPGLWASGMMNQSGFASAGYIIFGIFNRIELVCAALVLTGFLVLRNRTHLFYTNPLKERWSLILSGILLSVAIIYTYFLTPQISSLGLQLNQFEVTRTMPSTMVFMHGGYWLLELLKFVVGGILLRWCYRNSCILA